MQKTTDEQKNKERNQTQPAMKILKMYHRNFYEVASWKPKGLQYLLKHVYDLKISIQANWMSMYELVHCMGQNLELDPLNLQ